MSFLRPIQHSIVIVQFLSMHWVTTILYTLILNMNIKALVVGHNTVKFRDMKNFDMGSFPNDVISCDILNGSQDNDDISCKN